MKNKSFLENNLNFLRKLSLADIITLFIFIGILTIAAFFFLRRSDYVYVTVFVSQDEAYTPNYKPTAWYMNVLKPGMSSKDMLGRELITVTEVYRYNDTTPEPKTNVYVTLKVKSVYNKRTKQYSYNGNSIQIGTFQQFRLQDIFIAGMVRSMSTTEVNNTAVYTIKGFLDPRNNDYPVKSDLNYTLSNTLDTDGIPKSLSTKITNHLVMNDSKGKSIAEIVDISRKPGTIRSIQNGQILSVEDSQREQIELTISIEADMVDGKAYFQKEYPIAINNLLLLAFPDIILNMTITDIQRP